VWTAAVSRSGASVVLGPWSCPQLSLVSCQREQSNGFRVGHYFFILPHRNLESSWSFCVKIVFTREPTSEGKERMNENYMQIEERCLLIYKNPVRTSQETHDVRRSILCKI
jgi:hypothetical protein